MYLFHALFFLLNSILNESQISISKLTVFLELRSRKTVHISDQIMSADK